MGTDFDQNGLGIRLASPADAQGVLDVFAPYVRDTTVTFLSIVPSVEEYEAKITQILKLYPFLVCTNNDKVVGFAYASEMRSNDGYRWNVELSVYMDGGFQRRGMATALYTALFQILKIQGFVNLYAVIAVPNDASVALHKHFGFREVAVFENTGFKFGEWRDTVWMHHRLEGAIDPLEHGYPTAIGDINTKDIDNALDLAKALFKPA
ncbi:MAG: N-acetyltransferase family protein [Coriobacteriia bacterium]|nr:N-acetyltransferase family protein [Coriobacteriia bacterium]